MDKYYDNGRPETVTGNCGTAWISTQNNDDVTVKMIRDIMNSSLSEGTKVAIMPDCHVGKGCVVGFTQTLNPSNPRLSPDTIGVDIGCNITAMKFEADPAFMEKPETLAALDAFTRKNIGVGLSAFCDAGLSTQEKSLIGKEDLQHFEEAEKMLKNDLPNPKEKSSMRSAISQLKSIGSGNHFVELGRDSQGFYWLTIHSGSRDFGGKVCQVYRWHAKEYCEDGSSLTYKYLDRGTPYFDRYIYCVDACQRFSRLNHKLILNKLSEFVIRGFHRKALEIIGTMHNYFDLEHGIVRKGAVSAQAGEKLLIPFNMRDGIAVCEGKGNSDWNFSAPHGAGRLLARSEAKVLLDLDAAKAEMRERGIYSTSLDYAIDETADAYKPMEQILAQIGPTVEVKEMIRPLWNLKGRS